VTRVLCLTYEVPVAPGGTGGQTRQYRLLRRLVELGDEVTVVAPVHPADREGAERITEAGIGLHALHRPEGERAGEVLEAVLARPRLAPALARDPLMAWQAEVFWTALRPLAAEAIAERRPDVVLVEHDWAVRWARDLPGDIAKALTLHNLSWEYYASRAQAARGVRRRALGAEARRWRRFDAQHLRAYDLLLAMSERDAGVAQALTGVRTETLPNGVDTASLRLAPPPGEPVAIFTGRLDYPPNAEALRWLLDDIWPRVRAARPDARLLVVGPNPPAGPAPEGVEITGWVDSVAPYFERALVNLVPMRSGGGTRLKVLDAMATGRGIVSTAVGAMGVEVEDGEHLLLAESADDFAAATIRLFDDAALRERLGAAARRRAEERYDWTGLGERLHDLLSRLANVRTDGP
jgi:glycosyltransferase involved in cell wall biosynthesis